MHVAPAPLPRPPDLPPYLSAFLPAPSSSAPPCRRRRRRRPAILSSKLRGCAAARARGSGGGGPAASGLRIQGRRSSSRIRDSIEIRSSRVQRVLLPGKVKERRSPTFHAGPKRIWGGQTLARGFGMRRRSSTGVPPREMAGLATPERG
jgi:hypothetical protein